MCHTTGLEADTAEGRIIRWADKIAYMNHDIDDAIRAGVLREEEIPQSITDVLGSSKTQRITSLIRSVVENSREGKIAMDEVTYRAYEELSDFMYQAVYLNEYAKREERKVPHIIHSLFNHFREPGLPAGLHEAHRRGGGRGDRVLRLCGRHDRPLRRGLLSGPVHPQGLELGPVSPQKTSLQKRREPAHAVSTGISPGAE